MLFRLIKLMKKDVSGSVLPMFGLCIVVIFGSVGAAVDYSRAASTRTAMQAALDATAFMLVKEAAGLSPAQLTSRAQALFQANMGKTDAKGITITPTYKSVDGKNTISLESSGSIDTMIFRVFGKMQMPISTKSEVTWGMRRLELALALDNTGSMTESGKIEAAIRRTLVESRRT